MKPSALTAVNKELQQEEKGQKANNDPWGQGNFMDGASDLDEIQLIEDIPLQDKNDDIFNFTHSKVDLKTSKEPVQQKPKLDDSLTKPKERQEPKRSAFVYPQGTEEDDEDGSDHDDLEDFLNEPVKPAQK